MPDDTRSVLVLGAGVIGVTAAYALHRDGHAVTVVEAEPGPAMMTSYANGGHVSACNAASLASPAAPWKILQWLGKEDAPLLLRPRWDPMLFGWGLRFLRHCTAERFAANTDTLLKLSRYSGQMLSTVRGETGIDYEWHDSGILNLFRDQQGFDGAAAKIETFKALGIDADICDRARMVAIEPALSATRETYVGGIFSAGDETGDAHGFTHALADWLAQQGVTFHYGTPISGLRAEGGRVTGVETPNGTVLTADHYVVALGAHSPLLLRPLGIRLPVYPGKGYSVTVPVAGHNGAPRVSITDDNAKVVFARLGDRLRVAGTVELAGYNLDVSERRAEVTRDILRGVFPDGGNYDRAQYWTGLRPLTPDTVPYVGGTRYPNLFLNTGHGPLGWTTSNGSARMLADIIAGRTPDLDPALFALDRR